MTRVAFSELSACCGQCLWTGLVTVALAAGLAAQGRPPPGRGMQGGTWAG